MQLEWMGEYRDVVEALIHYCNIYASAYKNEGLRYGEICYSFAQIQVLEYLLESEDQSENMSAIAARLGISRSNFTKIAGRLTAKGLLQKTYMPGSRKAVKIEVTPLGRRLYQEYAQNILRYHFSPMFEALSRIPKQYYPCLQDAFYNAIHGWKCPKSAVQDNPPAPGKG